MERIKGPCSLCNLQKLGRDGRTKWYGGGRQGKVVTKDTDGALCELPCTDLTQPKASYNGLPGSFYRQTHVLRIVSKMKTTAPVSVGGSSGSLINHVRRLSLWGART